MGEVDPTFSIDLGLLGQFQWQVERAVLAVYEMPQGQRVRTVWLLEAADWATITCLFAESHHEGQHGPWTITSCPQGQQLTTALRELPGFDEEVFAAAEQVALAGPRGRFVCWERDQAATNAD